jgi:hypothetical protein
MGFRMAQNDSKFRIKAADTVPALRAIKDLVTGGKSYAWVNAVTVQRCRHIIDAMKAWGWTLDESEEGDIVGITFSSEKAGDDHVLLQAIAPFVEAGSYIEMHGEEGTRWRWIFDGVMCVEKTPKISWE